MRPQHEIKERHPLLDDNGHLIEVGYAKKLLLQYDRKKIKAPRSRIKEWDYYLIYNDDYALALTIDDNSYMGLDSISLLDFKNGIDYTTSPMKLFTFGKRALPPSSEIGDVSIKEKGYEMEYVHKEGFRYLKFRMENFYKGFPIEGFVRLDEIEDGDSMVIVTPYKEAKDHFYYNQKIVAMPARGEIHFMDKTYEFNPADSFGLLDWGRGVWTYKNTWYWGAGQGMVDGHTFGFNIGYGFGDTSAASENMLFYDGVGHKLSDVSFNIPKKMGKDDYMSPWTFTSDDGRFEMDFVPVMDRSANTDFIILGSNQHQVFGKFTGTAILDDGTKIHIKDFMGFAEKVMNKW